MKKEKRKTIERAVDYLKGKAPTSPDQRPYFLGSITGNIHLSNSSYAEANNPLCTLKEFEQVARQMGYINGFKWGVVYPTNGKKPDLPDDVFIQCFDGVEWWGSDASDLTVGDLLFNTSCTVKFRIIDQRYKPKGTQAAIKFYADQVNLLTPEGSYKDVMELIEDEFNKLHSNWYDSWGFPPVGTKCMVNNGGDSEYFECEVVAYHYNGNPILKTKGSSANTLTEKPECWKFRPIQTERDKVIEQLSILIHKWQIENNQSALDLAQRIIESGMLKIPEI